jgi:hypothetical protein
MLKHSWRLLPFITVLLLFNANAGVANPDISAIGQFSLSYTDDSTAQSPDKPTLGLGEAELVLDAALNPYLTGSFVFSVGKDDFEIEEAYASVIKGLPLNIGLKGGKYRVGFGRLNQSHPHVYPFIRTPRVIAPGMAMLLPGEESFNDAGLQASSLIPLSYNYAVSVSADLLQGDSFHPDTSTADFGWVARMVNSFIIADRAPNEVGFSLTRGINDPVYHTKSMAAGADLKTKITLSPTISLTAQSEFIYKTADHKDSLQTTTHENRAGFYAFVDTRFQSHYNAGILYEQYQSPFNDKAIDRGIKPFIGFNLLEESTILRFAYEYFIPQSSKATNSLELQFLYSMGPHKAHLF